DVTDEILATPFGDVVEAHRYWRARQDLHNDEGSTRKNRGAACGHKASLLATAALGGGSSNDAMVEVMGFEPTASSLRPQRPPPPWGRVRLVAGACGEEVR